MQLDNPSDAIDTLELLFDPLSIAVVAAVRDGKNTQGLGYPVSVIVSRENELISAGILCRNGSSLGIAMDEVESTIGALRTILGGKRS